MLLICLVSLMSAKNLNEIKINNNLGKKIADEIDKNKIKIIFS